MAEWSIAAVLKTVVPRGTWGSNPYFSADKCKKVQTQVWTFFVCIKQMKACFRMRRYKEKRKPAKQDCFCIVTPGVDGICERSELIPIVIRVSLIINKWYDLIPKFATPVSTFSWQKVDQKSRLQINSLIWCFIFFVSPTNSLILRSNSVGSNNFIRSKMLKCIDVNYALKICRVKK